MNYLKELARRFHLADEEWFALQPFLEDPPNEADRNRLIEDLLGRIRTPAERDAILSCLDGIVESDRAVTREEAELLERYKAVLSGASSLELVLGSVRRLFQAPPPPALDLDEFLRNKILFKLRRRSDGNLQVTPEMHRNALLGGLMGIVAQADNDFDERELDEIARQIRAREFIDEPELELLLTIIQEESVRGLDRHRLIDEYARDSSLEDRVELMDLLFGVAAADGGLTHGELEELRAISSALHLSHRQYIDAKLRARQTDSVGPD
jgi:uncharacterized tellurite resistance protein B-like protein